MILSVVHTCRAPPHSAPALPPPPPAPAPPLPPPPTPPGAAVCNRRRKASSTAARATARVLSASPRRRRVRSSRAKAGNASSSSPRGQQPMSARKWRARATLGRVLPPLPCVFSKVVVFCGCSVTINSLCCGVRFVLYGRVGRQRVEYR